MIRFSSELVIYVLIFAAILLFNYVARRIARWQKRQQEQAQQHASAEGELDPVRRQRGAPAEELFGRTQRKPTPAPDRELEHRARRVERPPVVPPASAQPRRQVRPFLAGRRNLRRAIISMVVLGPCRAQQPHDFR